MTPEQYLLIIFSGFSISAIVLFGLANVSMLLDRRRVAKMKAEHTRKYEENRMRQLSTIEE